VRLEVRQKQNRSVSSVTGRTCAWLNFQWSDGKVGGAGRGAGELELCAT
jgi:hypothetical protein